MSDEAKTKKQLIDELNELRQRIASFETRLAEQKQIEQVLSESENTFRSFIEQSNDGIFLIDEQGMIIEWNQAQAQNTGLQRDQVIGRFLGDISLGNTRNVDGTEHMIQTKTFPLKIGNKLAIGSISRDITQLKQTEETLRTRTLVLQERNEELDAFAHTVAHDLKNPLSIIIAYAVMLEDSYRSLTDEERLHDIREIEASSQTMFRIIDELLLLAGLREAEAVLEPVNMAEIVTTVRSRLALIIETSKATLTLPEVWPDAVGYAPWIEEVWANYLSNAIKYGGHPPCIELGATPDVSSRSVRFWIRDNGPGISEQGQARLFTPFTRLSQVRAQGHGLGLSIVNRIVKKLKGQVGVESDGVHGSTFFFTLPSP